MQFCLLSGTETSPAHGMGAASRCSPSSAGSRRAPAHCRMPKHTTGQAPPHPGATPSARQVHPEVPSPPHRPAGMRKPLSSNPGGLCPGSLSPSRQPGMSLAQLPAEPTPPAGAGTAALTLGGCQPIREEAGVPVPSRCSGWQEKQQHSSEEGSTAGPTWPPAWTEGRALPGFLPAQPAHGAQYLKRPHGAGSRSVGARCSFLPPRACPCLSLPVLRLFCL